MSMLVYRYGLRAPTTGADLVRAQMRLAHRYRCTLVEIERGRRAAMRAMLSSHGSVAELEAAAASAERAVLAAVDAVKAAKASSRSRSVPQDLREALTGARVARRDAVAALREARRALREDTAVAEARAAIDETAAGLRRNARAHCGVYWGTYLLIEAEDEAARKQPLYDGAAPNDPRFPRWTGDGTVGVQIQGGEDAVALVDGADTRMQIVRIADRNAVRGSTRFARLRMRVGSEGRAPIWAEWPMILHREMPKGARVKAAAVHVRRIGPREEWYVTITLDTSACAPTRVLGPCGAVAVDLGWRVREGERIRVACWVGEDGGSGEIELDERAISGLRLPESLRSQRDRNLIAARDALVVSLAAHGDEMPEWLREATRHLPLWRSASKLAALARRWRAQRWPGDAHAYDALERWRYHDEHLWKWESDQREGALRHRRDLYRVAAAALARRYGALVLEDLDLRPLVVIPAPDSDVRRNTDAQSNRQLAAPSELAGVLRNAFGEKIADVSAVDTTHECASCGHVDEFDAALALHHACSHCGAIWDQDYNAARVLLARHQRERSSGAQDSGGAREPGSPSEIEGMKESRWGRAKRAKRAKELAKGGAREPAATVAE